MSKIPVMDLYRNYKLTIHTAHNEVFIGMQVMTPFVNTCELKNTYQILENMYPYVLTTECFNEDNIPFHKEVKNTELGHLFEHILIATLLAIKLKIGAKTASFRGTTSWNWQEDPYGYFRINIRLNKRDLEFFEDAVFESINIFNLILENNQTDENTIYGNNILSITPAMKTA